MNRKESDDDKFRQWLKEGHAPFSTPPFAFRKAWALAQRRVDAPKTIGWLRPALGGVFALVLILSALLLRAPAPTELELLSLGDLTVPSDSLLEEQTFSWNFTTLPLGEDETENLSTMGDI